jgi:hypothetical protein
MKYLRYNLQQRHVFGNPPAYVTYLGSVLSFGRFEGRRGNAEKSPLDRFRNATNKCLLHPFMYNSFDSQNQSLQYTASLSHERQLKRVHFHLSKRGAKIT